MRRRRDSFLRPALLCNVAYSSTRRYLGHSNFKVGHEAIHSGFILLALPPPTTTSLLSLSKRCDALVGSYFAPVGVVGGRNTRWKRRPSRLRTASRRWVSSQRSRPRTPRDGFQLILHLLCRLLWPAQDPSCAPSTPSMTSIANPPHRQMDGSTRWTT